MKGNQGLQALAALCSGTGEAETMQTDTSLSNASPNIAPRNSGTSTSNSNGNESLTASQAVAAAAAAAAGVQQWSQALAAAASLQRAGGFDLAAAQSLLMSAGGLQTHQFPAASAAATSSAPTPAAAPTPVADNSAAFASAMQQLALQQYMQKLGVAQQAAAAQQQQHQQQQITAAQMAVGSNPHHHAALMMALATGKGQHLQQLPQLPHQQTQHVELPQRVIPPATSGSNNSPATTTAAPSAPTTALASIHPTQAKTAVVDGSNYNSSTSSTMKPPPPPSATAPINSLSSTSAAMSLGSYGGAAGGRILPNVERSSSHSMMMSSSVASTDYFSGGDDKKQIKRAANRRSAQLSRKRKKQFIEELKEENDDLRRKEQILRAIPDLIVVFDSSGKLGFVSESVGRFIDMSPEELEGTSFWDRLCEDSVRLLKAAFMDSLAARKPDSETAQLGSGVWELRLVDKDSNYMIVTLNGVVHFKGDVPECVCCIRPREQDLIQKLGGTSGGSTANGTGKQAKTSARAVSSSDGSRTSDGSSGKDEPRVRVNPRQSVVGNETSVAEEEERAAARKRRRRAAEGENGTNEEGQIVRISDGDSIEVSESGSDDGVASS